MFSALAWASGLGGGDGGVARLVDRLQRAALVGGVALHRLDQVGHEIVALLELDGDVRPGLIDRLAQADEAVVDDDREERDHDDDAKDDPAAGPYGSLRGRLSWRHSSSGRRRGHTRPVTGRGKPVVPRGRRAPPADRFANGAGLESRHDDGVDLLAQGLIADDLPRRAAWARRQARKGQ